MEDHFHGHLGRHWFCFVFWRSTAPTPLTKQIHLYSSRVKIFPTQLKIACKQERCDPDLTSMLKFKWLKLVEGKRLNKSHHVPDSLWSSPLLLLQMKGRRTRQSVRPNCGSWADQPCNVLQPCSSTCWCTAANTYQWSHKTRVSMKKISEALLGEN